MNKECKVSRPIRLVAQTDRGTPVYLLMCNVPEEVLPMSLKRRGEDGPEPHGEFSSWLSNFVPTNSCVIVKHKRRIGIYKINARRELLKITARSNRKDDRARLAEEGILR